MDCRRGTDARGFTLAEMLVALAILGLVTALALPSLARLGERMTFILERGDVERQIDQLPLRALGQGRAIVLDSSDRGAETYPVALPDGWQLSVDAPIRYRFDGTCSGGQVAIKLASFEARYLLVPPLCQLRAN